MVFALLQRCWNCCCFQDLCKIGIGGGSSIRRCKKTARLARWPAFPDFLPLCHQHALWGRSCQHAVVLLHHPWWVCLQQSPQTSLPQGLQSRCITDAWQGSWGMGPHIVHEESLFGKLLECLHREFVVLIGKIKPHSSITTIWHWYVAGKHWQITASLLRNSLHWPSGFIWNLSGKPIHCDLGLDCQPSVWHPWTCSILLMPLRSDHPWCRGSNILSCCGWL